MRLQLDSAVTGAAVTRTGDTGQTTSVGGAGVNPRNAAVDSGATDSIQISGLSSALNVLSSDRSARIAQLTALVQNGSYQVSSAQVSNAVVQQSISDPGNS